MKEKYIELMELTLSAYTNEHILSYFENVKVNGLTEHGFPRLTANIGILIAHGRRTDLIPIFLEMMDFCCATIPTVKAANDFSVREIISCIEELEKTGKISSTHIDNWKREISTIVPEECYNVIADSPESPVRNWALFTGVSEYYRHNMCLCDNEELIETQIASQLKWFDDNGMYMDNTFYVNRQPFVYDFVPRGLFCLLLNKGYRGKYYKVIDNILRKAGLLTLKMQSVNGEIPFGGRSNQFLHNEPWLALIGEYEAKRYLKEGNIELAQKFKNAAARAIAVTEEWLKKEPIRHIKNRFPTETSYGCEDYAYFDKYMITTASFLHGAYAICDDLLEAKLEPNLAPTVFITTAYFGKVFLKSGGYGIEYDLDGDPHYDASGVGRIHRADSPSAICMSCPCPSTPDITLDIKPVALSLSPAIKCDGHWQYASIEGVRHYVTECHCDCHNAYATIKSIWQSGQKTVADYSVGQNGVEIAVSGYGDVGYSLPAFAYDGESKTNIILCENKLEVFYSGWVCRYIAECGKITDIGTTSANRNGHYRIFAIQGKNSVKIKIEIERA